MLGYIGRHWRGELSLPWSYWVNGVLVNLPFNLYFRIADLAVETDPPRDPLAFVYVFLLPILLLYPVAIWSGVGIWRSAGVRIGEGRSFWAWVARLVVAINILVLVSLGVRTAALTYSAVTAAQMERNADYHITVHETAVIFHGMISEAAGDKLEAALKGPHIRRLIVNGSVGGFLNPAIRVARIIKDRKLAVVALAQCESACTLLLASGAIRAVTPRTATGFHRGSVVGLTERARQDVQGDEIYRAAGLSDAFIAKVRSHHGPTDLYDPPLKELIDQGFVTEIYDIDAKLYYDAKDWCALHVKTCGNTGRQNWILKFGHFP